MSDFGLETTVAFTGEPLRLMAIEDLGTALLNTSDQVESEEWLRDAFALAATYWRKELQERDATEEEEEEARRRMQKYSDLHMESVQMIANMQKSIAAIQTELQWRHVNPDFDPEDPFRGE